MAFLEHEIFKEQYNRELEKKSELDKSIGFPTTIQTIFIGSAYIIANEYLIFPVATTSIAITYIVSIIAFTLSSLTSIYFLVKLFHDNQRNYQLLSYPRRMAAFLEELASYNDHDKEKTLEEFESNLFDDYIIYSDHNAKVNDERERYYANARRFIVISSILFIFSSIVVLIDKFFI